MIKQISFKSRGYDIFGFAHIPSGDGPKPAIVMCHGFTGNCIESGRLFVEFANKACENGYHVIRFDCVGSGNSTGDFSRHTYLGGWVEDLQNAVNYTSLQKEIDSSRICILGFSFGGAAALISGKDERVAAVVAWSPVIKPVEIFKGILGAGNWQQLELGNSITAEYGGTPFKLDNIFADEMKKHNIFSALDHYGVKPLLMIQGTEDKVIDIRHFEEFLDYVENPTVHYYVEGDSHEFIRGREVVYKTTIDFLDTNFKQNHCQKSTT